MLLVAVRAPVNARASVVVCARLALSLRWNATRRLIAAVVASLLVRGRVNAPARTTVAEKETLGATARPSACERASDEVLATEFVNPRG
jgi:hypothetical protein